MMTRCGLNERPSHTGSNALGSPALTSTGSVLKILTEHFGNGDGSPPITAFTANDSYSDEELRREEDRAKAHTGSGIPRFTFSLSNPSTHPFTARSGVLPAIGLPEIIDP